MNIWRTRLVTLAMRTAITLIFLLGLASVTLPAADATGTWTGNLIISSEGGEQTRPAHLVLKQDGSKLTGTAGPDGGEQHPIEKGKIEAGSITFEVPRGEIVMKFALKQEGDQITGTITRERDGRTETVKIVVKRSS